MQDAVILSCCCQIVGCRTHIQDLINETEFVCPLCKANVTPGNIKSLPVLSQSIATFIKQSTTLVQAEAPVKEKTPEPEPAAEKEKEKEKERDASRSSTRRYRSRSRDRSSSRHRRPLYGSGMPSGTPIGRRNLKRSVVDLTSLLRRDDSHSRHSGRSRSRSSRRSYHSHHSHHSHHCRVCYKEHSLQYSTVVECRIAAQVTLIASYS